jgi:hypothetical protein
LKGRLCPQFKKQAFDSHEAPTNFFNFLAKNASGASHAVVTDAVRYPTENALAVANREVNQC